MIIYKITNLINHKIYVGQTQQELAQRWREHCCYKASPKMLISKAIQKYGKENFTIEILAIAENLEHLNILEVNFISELNALNPKIGYNRRSGGQNYIMQESTKEKIRQANLGKKASEETKAKMSESQKKRPPRTKEQCNAIRERLLGSKHTQERIENMKKARVNFKPSEEHKRKNSEKMKGVPKSEETKAKMRAFHARKKLERQQNG